MDADVINVGAGQSLEAQVAVLRVQGNNTAQAVSKIELGMKDQDGKLDLLVADMNKRAGAEATKKTLRGAIFTLLTSTSIIGWAWEHFHK